MTAVEERCFRDSVSPNEQFLLESYSNTQQVIQFFDTKAGAYLAVSGALASLLVGNVLHVVSGLLSAPEGFAKYALLVLVSGIASAFLFEFVQVIYRAFLVVYPRHGPQLVRRSNAAGLFWAGDIVEYLREHTLEQYAEAVCAMKACDIIAELAYEVAKLSQITCIKLKYLEKATRSSRRAIVLWAVSLVVTAVAGLSLPYLA